METAIYLGTLPYVDKERIGIWGWSFGGFNTLMSMSEGREVFRAGVAVAPVTDWRFYDTVYTERYMQTPQENGMGYDDNPIKRVEKLQADKDFSERLYRNRNHSINGGNTRNHLLRQIAQHFIKNLK